MPTDGSVAVEDVTSSFGCFGLWGQGWTILGKVTQDDVSNEGFPYMTAKRIMSGPFRSLAVRVTYVGELGWEFYSSTEYGHGCGTRSGRRGAGRPGGRRLQGHRHAAPGEGLPLLGGRYLAGLHAV